MVTRVIYKSGHSQARAAPGRVSPCSRYYVLSSDDVLLLVLSII